MKNPGIVTYCIRLYGIVQGVGMRPHVSRLAEKYRVCGSVCNMGSYVEIIAQGSGEAVSQFINELKVNPPVRADVLEIRANEIKNADFYCDFKIIESEAANGEIFISPDIAICEECARELMDPGNRRYLHPFINCTQCGPRLTIIDSLPYDRERTSMKNFPMCGHCAEEYHNPASRRYDAQPVCCNDCGPEVYLLEKADSGTELLKGEVQTAGDAGAAPLDNRPLRDYTVVAEAGVWKRTLSGGRAIAKVRRVIMEGGIAAIKGIGGFHLACDAKNAAAVERLRVLKRRPRKPFAVMMRDMDAAARECNVSEEEKSVLTGHEKPIILLRKKNYPDGRHGCIHSVVNVSEKAGESGGHVKSGNFQTSVESEIADAVAPGNPKIGVMLPYAPVQILVFRYPDGLDMTDTLVMTSGNISGAPICASDEEAERELYDCADVILSNNRPIRMRCDDSVMELYRGRPYMIRRSRGYAPLPFRAVSLESAGNAARTNTENCGSFGSNKTGFYETHAAGRNVLQMQSVLAIGGELKNTFCVKRGDLLYLSPYVGDLSDTRTENVLYESVYHFLKILETRPEAVVCDMHPGYRSVKIAEKIGREMNIPVIRVQHHYAHVLSCMAENDCPGSVIGVSFDGTGYGTDGTIWGGEVLYARRDGFRRIASITPFIQAGGDISSREGWRIAASLIIALADEGLLCEKTGPSAENPDNTEKDRFTFQGAPEKNHNSQTISSAGSLKDNNAPEENLAEKIIRELGVCGRREARIIRTMMKSGINSVTSTSCGRLFDAAAAVLGICRASSYEGEAANKLMFAAQRYADKIISCANKKYDRKITGKDSNSSGHASGRRDDSEKDSVYKLLQESAFGCVEKKSKSLAKSDAGMLNIRTDLLMRDLILRKLAGEDPEYLAYLFHLKLAESITVCLKKLRADFQMKSEKKNAVTKETFFCPDKPEHFPDKVCLTGGCFQNTLLLDMTKGRLEEAGFTVLTHSLVPSNDGGIALGQAYYFAPSLYAQTAKGQR